MSKFGAELVWLFLNLFSGVAEVLSLGWGEFLIFISWM
jgi:hypothetical protein